jgi:hypothetical protein
MKQWYYSGEGSQLGPVSEDELLGILNRGEIGGSSLVWHEGMADWIPLSQFPDLLARATPGASMPAATLQRPDISLPPRDMAGSVPLPQPPAYHGNYISPVIPTYMWQSVVALVISAGMMMVICLPIGMPFAIVALVYASKVEGLRLQGRLMEAESASKSAKLWMIISYVLSGIIFLCLAVVLVIFISGAVSGAFSP